MIAFKGFTKDLTATRGKGIFQYRPGETYEEEKSKTRRTGFHCAEYILDCMTWYPMDGESRFFSVEAEGSIDEEKDCSMVVCTRITLLKELTAKEIAGHAMMYMVKHPLREWRKKLRNVEVEESQAEAETPGSIAIARGMSPKVKGAAGSILGLILEPELGKIVQAKLFTAGKEVKADTWYTLTEGRELIEV